MPVVVGHTPHTVSISCNVRLIVLLRVIMCQFTVAFLNEEDHRAVCNRTDSFSRGDQKERKGECDPNRFAVSPNNSLTYIIGYQRKDWEVPKGHEMNAPSVARPMGVLIKKALSCCAILF